MQTTATSYERRCIPNPFRRGRSAPPPLALTSQSSAAAPRPSVAWDAALGVYQVVDHPCTWVRLGTYYRFQGGVWQSATQIEGPWSLIEEATLPGHLATADDPCIGQPEPD